MNNWDEDTDEEEMKVNRFNPGDVVMLKSGSVRMTVESVIDTEMIGVPETGFIQEARRMGFEEGDLVCIWFKRNDKKVGFFKADTVKIVLGEWESDDVRERGRKKKWARRETRTGG